MTVRLSLVGFGSSRNGHRHLLKHVLRVIEQDPESLTRPEDPEHWSDLIREPPMMVQVIARRRQAIVALELIEHCAIRDVVTDDRCRPCVHSGAQRAADAALSPQMDAYLEVARAALSWAFANKSRTGPRAIAFREHGTAIIKLVSDKGVRVVGDLDPVTGEVQARTVFRIRNRNFNSRALELARERAGHERAGNLIPSSTSMEPEMWTPDQARWSRRRASCSASSCPSSGKAPSSNSTTCAAPERGSRDPIALRAPSGNPSGRSSEACG